MPHRNRRVDVPEGAATASTAGEHSYTLTDSDFTTGAVKKATGAVKKRSDVAFSGILDRAALATFCNTLTYVTSYSDGPPS